MVNRLEHPDLLSALEEALDSAGSLRSVWCAPSVTFETRITQRRGILLGGAWSPQFIRESAAWQVPFTRTLNRPRVLLTHSVSGELPEWLPFLEELAKGSHFLLVIAERVEEILLRTLIVNSLRVTLDVCVVRSEIIPSHAFGDALVQIPRHVSQLPVCEEALVRKRATAVFLAEDRFASEDIFIIEVGGEDFEDQQDRLRLLSGLIRQRERDGT